MSVVRIKVREEKWEYTLDSLLDFRLGTRFSVSTKLSYYHNRNSHWLLRSWTSSNRKRLKKNFIKKIIFLKHNFTLFNFRGLSENIITLYSSLWNRRLFYSIVLYLRNDGGSNYWTRRILLPPRQSTNHINSHIPSHCSSFVVRRTDSDT